MLRDRATYTTRTACVPHNVWDTAISSSDDGWYYDESNSDFAGNQIFYPMSGSQSDWTCFLDTQAIANAREFRHKRQMYDYFLRCGLRLRVQVVDWYGKDVMGDGSPGSCRRSFFDI